MPERVLVLHTTESDSFSATHRYFQANPGKQPHVMIDPATGDRVKYFPWSQPAKALRNLPGGVETNRRPGVIQVEIIGRAEQIPNKPAAWFERLAAELTEICRAAEVPIRFPVPFVPYPASYGLRARQRLTGPEWLEVSGIIGHQHVPENDHGDPGDMSRLIPLMEATMPTPDRTEFVKQMQRALNTWGAGLKVDGDPGPATAAALEAVMGEAVRIKNRNTTLTADLELAHNAHASLRVDLDAARAEVARLAALDTVARQAPLVLTLIQAGRAELNRIAAELDRIGGQ